jgi:hypothetical protein
MLFNFFNRFYNDAVIANDVDTMLRMERALANVQIDRQWREERERAAATGSLALPAGNLPTIGSV